MVEWGSGGGTADIASEELLTDSELLKLMQDPLVTRIGIDAPFGWPDQFVNALVGWRDHGIWPVEPDAYETQRPLVLRETDRRVHASTGRWPLSVSTDRIAFAGMRCARLLAALAKAGTAIDRSGAGRVIEVYPEAALRQWNLSPAQSANDPGGYKGPAPQATDRRHRLLTQLRERTAGWLTLNDQLAKACLARDDPLDALLCALIARAADLELLEPVTEADRARTEGWIRLPRSESLELLGGARHARA
ncbi:MAG: DUF429 domain-containing protein [Solirubrobacteraceae bacterium]|nr:MAG: DUF429 domain-containing protein [Solirubrobacterales bacterium]